MKIRECASLTTNSPKVQSSASENLKKQIDFQFQIESTPNSEKSLLYNIERSSSVEQIASS